jgi:hypothetical protein
VGRRLDLFYAVASAGQQKDAGANCLSVATSPDLTPTLDRRGYRLVAADGGVISFGDTTFMGSANVKAQNKPMVAIASDFASGGHWLVASDGGVFAYDAPFAGATGALTLNSPVNGMAATPATGGYWLLGADSGVFAHGVPFLGPVDPDIGRGHRASQATETADPQTSVHAASGATGRTRETVSRNAIMPTKRPSLPSRAACTSSQTRPAARWLRLRWCRR